MKKFLILILLIACSAGTVMAQNNPNKQKRGFGLYLGADRDTLQYIVASPFDNWFFSGSIGANTFIGNEYDIAARFNPLDVNFAFEIGKWVIPDVAVAFNFSMWGMHGQTRYAPHPFVDFTNVPILSLTQPEPGNYYEYQKFSANVMSLTGLVEFEWTNFFNGYEKGDTKKWHVITPFGLGYSMLYGEQKNPRGFSTFGEGGFRRNFELHFMAGLTVEYRLTKVLAFNVTAKNWMTRGSIDWSPLSTSEDMSSRFDYVPMLQAGVRLNMIKRVTKVDPRTGKTYTASVNHQFMPASTERITYLESRIDTLVEQMSSIGQFGDLEAAGSVNTVRDLNRQLDSLQQLLAGGQNANNEIKVKFEVLQQELETLITRMNTGRKPLDIASVESLVVRQKERQDSILKLEARVVKLQTDLDKGLGSPAKIKAEMEKLLTERDKMLDDGESDNLDYGIDNAFGMYSNLDAAQTAHRALVFNEMLNNLSSQLTALRKVLDGPQLEKDSVSNTLAKAHAQIAGINELIGTSGLGHDNIEMTTLLSRQRARHDTIASHSARLDECLRHIAKGEGDLSKNSLESIRMRYSSVQLTDYSQKDNAKHNVSDDNGVLTPYVAAMAAYEQSNFRSGVDRVQTVFAKLQGDLNTGDLAPDEIQRRIKSAYNEVENLLADVSFGLKDLSQSDAAALLDRQQDRRARIAGIDSKAESIQNDLESGRGNAADLRAELLRILLQRQEILADAKADNDKHGISDEKGNLDPFEAAQISNKRVAQRDLMKSLSEKLDQLMKSLDVTSSSDDQVRGQIAATKAEIENIKETIGAQNVAKLSAEQYKRLVESQRSRMDSVAMLDKRITTLVRRVQRGSGDPQQLKIEIDRLTDQIDALRSAAKKENAQNSIDTRNGALSPLVAAENAAEQARLINHLASIRSMLDALLRQMGAQSPEEAIRMQIAEVQSRRDSISSKGGYESLGLTPEEARALVSRQVSRQDSIDNIDRRLKELERMLSKGKGDPAAIKDEIKMLKEKRSELGSAAEKDNLAHGVSNADRRLDPLSAARLAADQAAEIAELMQLNSQLDSLKALLNQERLDADPMARIFDAIDLLDLPQARVYYQLDKYDLDYNARKVLHDFALRLKRNGTDRKFLIIGAADAQTGTYERNQTLSYNRCKAVYDVLVRSYGVPESQLEMCPLGGITEFEIQESNRTAIIVLNNSEIVKIIDKWNRISQENAKAKK